MISQYLPSKKFSKILIIVVIIGLVFFFVARSNNIRKTKATKQTLMLTPEQIIEGDRDNDGLRDWEEALWGTNPDNADSDGNGVNDLSEIEVKRQEIAKQQGIDLTEEQGELNETDMFSRDIFASIISLKEKGALNTETIKGLANAAEQSFASNMDLANTAELSDLAIQKEDTIVQQKAYLKKIDTLMVKYQDKGVNSEYKVFSEYTLSDNKNLLIKLSEVGVIYEQLSAELIKTPVPSSYSKTHLDFINVTHKMSIALNNISLASDNELISTIGISQYKEQYVEYLNLLNIFTDLISVRGIL